MYNYYRPVNGIVIQCDFDTYINIAAITIAQTDVLKLIADSRINDSNCYLVLEKNCIYGFFNKVGSFDNLEEAEKLYSDCVNGITKNETTF